jgi:hypothetical protein
MATEADPGVSGTKLSKSGGEDVKLIERNKSYLKVLGAQNAYIVAQKTRSENAEELRVKWHSKSEWHEKEFGW